MRLGNIGRGTERAPGTENDEEEDDDDDDEEEDVSELDD